MFLLAFRSYIRPQPQGDARRLHRLSNHAHQIVAKSVQIGLVPEFGRQSFEGLGSIVLAAVEATIYKRLDATTQRVEQGRDYEGRAYDAQLW